MQCSAAASLTLTLRVKTSRSELQVMITRTSHLPPDAARDGESGIAGHADHLQPIRHLRLIGADSVIHLPVPEANVASKAATLPRRAVWQQWHNTACLSLVAVPQPMHPYRVVPANTVVASMPCSDGEHAAHVSCRSIAGQSAFACCGASNITLPQ